MTLYLLTNSSPVLSQISVVKKDVYRKEPTDLLDLKIVTNKRINTNKTSFEDKDLKDAPGNISYFSAEDIKRSSVTFLGDLLNLVPGISIVSSGGVFRSIALHGMNLDLGNFSVYLDENLVTESYLGSYSLGLHTPLANIENVTVVTNPSAVRNGTDSGLCSVWLTTQSNKTRQIINLNGLSSFGNDQIARYYFDFKNQQKFKNGIKYYIGGHFVTGDLGHNTINDFYGNNTDFNQKITADSQKYNVGITYKNNFNLFFVSDSYDYQNNYIGSRVSTQVRRLKVNYTHAFSNYITSYYTINLSNDKYSNQEDLIGIDTDRFSDIDTNRNYINTLSKGNRVETTGGFFETWFRFDINDQAKWNILGKIDLSQSLVGKDNIITYNTLNMSLVNELDYKIGDWSFIGSVRVENLNVAGMKILPHINLQKRVKTWLFGAGFYQYYRTPVIIYREMYGDDVPVYTSSHAQLRVSKQFSKETQVTATFFRILHAQTRTNEESATLDIERNAKAAQPVSSSKNTRETFGGETTLTYKSDRIRLNVFYSYYFNKQNDFFNYQEHALNKQTTPGVPQNKFGGTAHYQIRKNISVSVNYTFEDVKSNTLFFKNDAAIFFRLPQSHFVNFRLHFDNLIGDFIDAKIGVNNVLDAQNFVLSSSLNDPYPTPRAGREYNISLFLNIKSY